MSHPRSDAERLSQRAGFTLAELLVYLLLSVLAIAAILQMFIGQNRLYTKQRELMDVRGSLRTAAAFIAWELRQPAAADGDLAAISQNSFTLRSMRGGGIICGEHKTNLRFGLTNTSGEFHASEDDSALVFVAGQPGTGDDGWRVVKVDKFYNAPGGGVPTCFWSDANAGRGRPIKSDVGADWAGVVIPDTVIEVSGDMDSVFVGAPVRLFRRIEYGLYQEDGRWWLGRRIGSAASYERLIGPLRPPTDSGLVFTWYDSSGNVTANPGDVSLVEVILRAESLKAVRRVSSAPSAQQDTMTFRVALRG